MATIERFEGLDVWQNARKLTNHVYGHTRREPFSKDFGLRDQIQRAAGKVRAQLYVAPDQDYISEAEFETVYKLVETTSRQLFRLIEYLKSRPNASRVQEENIAHQIDLDESE